MTACEATPRKGASLDLTHIRARRTSTCARRFTLETPTPRMNTTGLDTHERGEDASVCCTCGSKGGRLGLMRVGHSERWACLGCADQFPEFDDMTRESALRRRP